VETKQLVNLARRQVADLTGQTVEGISGFHRDDGEGWTVLVEVLELERIPNTMDLLASYAVTMSDDGDVVGMERRRRYHRAAVDGD